MGNEESWLNRILINAIENKASDVHFDPGRENIKIRFRIDGILYIMNEWSKGNSEMVISRIKVLSKMNIAERRLPQDGHFEFTHKDKIYNIRSSTFPAVYGETIVLRFFNKEDVIVEFEQLGFDQNQLEIVNKLIHKPYGMSLITGPSGSGKTTLLYSILNKLNQPAKNIITLEDPIELQSPDIRQAQVNEAIGLSFDRGLRSILRQDPDVIMIGEIRDPSSAQMAIQAALTGILVFSTFHTVDVPTLVARLIEMDIPRSVVAQALTGVISSRLVRKICDLCKEEYPPSDLEKKFLGIEEGTHIFKKGKGCELCHHSGYLGRIGIFEIVYFDDEIRSFIVDQQSPSALQNLLKQKNIKSLREAAKDKIIQGITTPEEVIRVIGPSL